LSRIRAVTAALFVCCCLPATAGAAQTVTLHTSFSPDRLGASTTIGFGFQITNPNGSLPAPLTSLSLLARGLGGCSPNSRLGYGSAFVEVPFGQGSGHEIPEIQALMGPPHNGNIVVLFYANGQEPVYAQLVFQGELVSGSNALGGDLNAAIPLIPSVPGGAPVSIVSVESTIGPSHLTYYKHVHGKKVAFHPKGVSVPLSCPREGFTFSATFGFSDGTSAVANSVVPCPPRRR
jgi:hypothetical protein